MPLPEFSNEGELPAGVHQATIEEVVARFGKGAARRLLVTTRLLRIYHLARATGKLKSLVIFGSYVTAKAEPNDVDVVLVMHDDFVLGSCDDEAAKLFEHGRAEAEFGASIFWIRPSLLIAETLEEFIAHWQVKRDRTRRGIMEVRV